MSALVFAQGFGLGAGLIIAIGAQNAFVLRQGLRHEHRLSVATISALGDAILITIGGLGLGGLIAARPWLADGAALFGAAFLAIYGALALKRAFSNEQLKTNNETGKRQTFKQAALMALGFSLLNPHAYLDTVVLLGSISGQHDWPARAWFILGAVSASFVWFFGLVWAAGRLAPLFRAPLTWKVLDTCIALIMWAIAASLAARFI